VFLKKYIFAVGGGPSLVNIWEGQIEKKTIVGAKLKKKL
jgi:hypothetical protein